MTYEEFRTHFYPLIDEEAGDIFAVCSARSWEEIEPVLRRQLDLRNVFRHPPMSSEKYLSCLNERGQALFRTLKAVRTKLASAASVPPYSVFQNRTLYEMTVFQPFDMESLRKLYGVGEKNSARFGERFLEVIREAAQGERFPALPDMPRAGRGSA